MVNALEIKSMEKHNIPYICMIAGTLAFTWVMFSFIKDRKMPKRFGCTKVYKQPPMWRCGHYGVGGNRNVLYSEVWVSEEKYFPWVEADPLPVVGSNQEPRQ